MWNIDHVFKLCGIIYMCVCVFVRKEREMKPCDITVLKLFADIL